MINPPPYTLAPDINDERDPGYYARASRLRNYTERERLLALKLLERSDPDLVHKYLEDAHKQISEGDEEERRRVQNIEKRIREKDVKERRRSEKRIRDTKEKKK